MNENTLFLTNSDESKKNYCNIISETAKAIADSFTDDKAYEGPTPQELQKIVNVDNILPDTGLGFETVLNRVKKQVLPNFLRTPSTDYMAHLHSAATLETIASELIITTFNQSMDSWDQSPVATEIEENVVHKLCEIYGYNVKEKIVAPKDNCALSKHNKTYDLSSVVNGFSTISNTNQDDFLPVADGIFTSGGSQSNTTGLTLARDWYCNKIIKHDVKKYGLPENYRKLRMYTSCISHFSMEKSAHLLGLGYDSVVKVPVDSKQKMDFNALTELVENDIENGNIPFCVVATIGTTDFGSIDPVKEIAQLCKKHRMWLHADAAYGSGVILSKPYASRIEGLSECDSITVDFHKMFLMPISCSCVLVKDKQNFEPLTIHADYLNREEDEEDGYTNLVDKSMQTTRRFDGLKVWVAFQTRGQDGWSELITKCMDNATYLYEKLEADPDFEVITKPEISSVVFRLTPKGCGVSTNAECDEVNRKVRRSLIHDHGVVIGQTVCHENVCLKFTLLNPLVTCEKLDSLLKLIKNLGKE